MQQHTLYHSRFVPFVLIKSMRHHTTKLPHTTRQQTPLTKQNLTHSPRKKATQLKQPLPRLRRRQPLRRQRQRTQRRVDDPRTPGHHRRRPVAQQSVVLAIVEEVDHAARAPLVHAPRAGGPAVLVAAAEPDGEVVDVAAPAALPGAVGAEDDAVVEGGGDGEVGAGHC